MHELDLILCVEGNTQDRSVNVEAMRQHFELIPDDPCSPIVQKIFTEIQNMNANFVMMQNRELIVGHHSKVL